MRIQSINYFANKAITRNSYNVVQNYKTKPLQMDTVSFKGRPTDIDEVLNLKKRADAVQKNAEIIKSESEEYALEAYDIFDETKQSFMKAMQYVDVATRAVSRDKSKIDLSSGNRLDIISIKNKKGQLVPLLINVYDELDNHVQNIQLKNYVPSQIIEYKEDGKVRISQFASNSIILSENAMPSEGTVETGYVFTDGKLVSVRKDRRLNTLPFYDDKTYFYNEKGDIWLAESATETYNNGRREIEDRYNFQNGKLASYYSNFTMLPSRLMSWDESFHYDPYKFIGYTQNAAQVEHGKPAIAKSATYFDKMRKFVDASGLQCFINDFAPTIFKEK